MTYFRLEYTEERGGICSGRTMKQEHRIQLANGTFLNAGTGEPSWFTIDEARQVVDRSAGQIILWFYKNYYLIGETF